VYGRDLYEAEHYVAERLAELVLADDGQAAGLMLATWPRASQLGNARTRSRGSSISTSPSRAALLRSVCPNRRFAGVLAGANARLGVVVGRYSFDVEPCHLLLHAGLSRRTNS
jgi:hypothetical protein